MSGDERLKEGESPDVEPHSWRGPRADKDSTTPDAQSPEEKAEAEQEKDRPDVEPHSYHGI